nr:nucleotide exchange factor GrpE [Candidatus Freyarchaeota archaeon]
MAKSTEKEKRKESKKKKDEEKESPEEIIKKLEKSLEEEKKRADEYLNKLMYLQADFENYRKRVEKEKEGIVSREKARLITRLLVVLDELELAIKSGKEAEDKNVLVEGVEMVFNKLQNLLCDEGLCEIEALGKPFNPELHEAVLTVQTNDHPNNTVVEEMRKGYMLDGRVVRPSIVKVAKNPITVEANSGNEEKESKDGRR